MFSPFQAILAGDFILSVASMAMARIGNNTVVKVFAQVIEDLVRGTANQVVHAFFPCHSVIILIKVVAKPVRSILSTLEAVTCSKSCLQGYR